MIPYFPTEVQPLPVQSLSLDSNWDEGGIAGLIQIHRQMPQYDDMLRCDKGDCSKCSSVNAVLIPMQQLLSCLAASSCYTFTVFAECID